MKNLILPPNYLEDYNEPMIFLAGPISGAPIWHEEAIDYIKSKESNILIACPSWNMSEKYAPKMNHGFTEQVDWETHHLNQSGKNGVVLFWMPKQKDFKIPRPYAQTTRDEFGEWRLKTKLYDSGLAVGIEEGFPGIDYIQRRTNQDCPNIYIHNTLEETCKDAIKQAQGQRHI